MNDTDIDIFQNLHIMYNASNHRGTPEAKLEHHIDLKASDIQFISLEEAQAQHKEYHSLIAKTHPLIMVYGDTLSHEGIPLVLFVGREPNDRREVGGWVGKYNFDGSARKRRCAFWNMAYKLVGETMRPRLESRVLKTKSKALRSSVIALADISTRSMPYSKRGKRAERESALEEKLESHTDQILRNPLMKRVRFILLSGSDRDGLKPYRDRFEQKAKDRGKDCIQIPFLSGNTYPKVRSVLDQHQEVNAAIQEAASRWASLMSSKTKS